ncbi:corresponds to STY3950 from Accession AL513382: Salmonella typhi CT18 [Klebsiella pneumoniae IS22]|nr:corresponds to STY3950 from Accession AL513382: Salmonella typhi CT18 [Klebsiella pneumoniae IS22]
MRKAFWLLFALALPALAQDPVLPAVTAIHTAPTLGELPPPESLRPCCAFGYDLHVRAAGIPIPMYQIGNVLTLGTLVSTITTTARSVR